MANSMPHLAVFRKRSMAAEAPIRLDKPRVVSFT